MMPREAVKPGDLCQQCRQAPYGVYKTVIRGAQRFRSLKCTNKECGHLPENKQIVPLEFAPRRFRIRTMDSPKRRLDRRRRA